MRVSTLVSSLLLAATALAVPLNNAPAKRDLAVRDTTEALSEVGLKKERRQLGLDLGSLTGVLDDLVGTLTGLLPGITSTLVTVEAQVNIIVTGTESEVNALLGSVEAELNGILADLNGLDLGSLSGVTGGAGSDLDLTSVINTVTGLLNSLTSLTGGADTSAVTNLLNEILGILNGLTTVLGRKL